MKEENIEHKEILCMFCFADNIIFDGKVPNTKDEIYLLIKKKAQE